MNSPFRSPELPFGTQAAEGLTRRRWSVAEIEAMTRARVLDEDERFELIGGEIVPMNAKGIRHETLKNALNIHWAQRLPKEFRFALETTFRMSEDTFVEPDFVFYRTADGLAQLNPRTALLAVEVADSSLAYDLGRKARIYANFGVPEVWVIEAVTLVSHVHRQPGLNGYGEIKQFAGTEKLAPSFAPALSVVLAKLDPV
jgi:Uma2 family endonuclease